MWYMQPHDPLPRSPMRFLDLVRQRCASQLVASGTRRTAATRSTPWSRWRWRSTGSRTGRRPRGWSDGSSPPLHRLRPADRVGEPLSGLPAAATAGQTLASDPPAGVRPIRPRLRPLRGTRHRCRPSAPDRRRWQRFAGQPQTVVCPLQSRLALMRPVVLVGSRGATSNKSA
jgi:hypothetical protein